MAVGEIYVNKLRSRTAQVDFSYQVQRIGMPDTQYGRAFARTLTYLGLGVEHVETKRLKQMVVRGSTETAQERVGDLRRAAGLIACDAAGQEPAFQPFVVPELGRVLDKLTDQTIPGLGRDVPLTDLLYTLARPFAEAEYPFGVIGHTDGCKAPWLATPAELAVAAQQELRTGQEVCIPIRLDTKAEVALNEMQRALDEVEQGERLRLVS